MSKFLKGIKGVEKKVVTPQDIDDIAERLHAKMETKSEFISALEFFWNQHVSKMDNVLLIACGSASSWIRKNLINARGGLYNRITQRIKLVPFNLYETSLFLQSNGVNLPQYQILELYMAMGGIPFYLKEVEKGKSVPQLIDDICFSPQGLLTEEYEQLYHSLFRNAELHVSIIETLAANPQGMTRTEIANVTKIPESSLSRTVEELTECDFITYFPPFLNKKKEGIYKLTDLYSLFYLKFIQYNKGSGNKIKQFVNEPAFPASIVAITVLLDNLFTEVNPIVGRSLSTNSNN